MTTSIIPKFEVLFNLQEHSAGTTVTKISPDGSHLLSADQEGTVIIWDLRTGRSLQRFNLSTSQGISAAIWCPVYPNEPAEAFAIGEATGRVTIYRRLQATNYDYASTLEAFTGPVEDIAYDPRHRRLAMAGDGCLKLFGLNGAYTMSFIHSTTPREQIARSTGFYSDGACVFVCFLEAQHITCYAINPWAVQFDGDLDTRIGCAVLREGGELFVSNLKDGMDVYTFPPRAIPVRNARFHIDRNFPLDVAVATSGEFAVIGGEDGHARIYNTHLGVMDALLPHGNHDSLIQHVDVYTAGRRTIIVTGCADDTDGSLKVWVPVARSRRILGASEAFRHWASWGLRYACLVIAVYVATLVVFKWLSRLIVTTLSPTNLPMENITGVRWRRVAEHILE
ncbi:WD40 repeat-like protein [Coprinellus micaceus]|uniref:WD40 repeat-like protein n=1 Tax=Coprinellus micaceus TaxID=71717 RepID=A0A4Y7TZ30_COPMI|nr:WD40 repeat-like protein [Coprinellus micaceus]